MKKEITYDKPRIVSTVILGIVLVAALIFAILMAPFTWTSIQEAESSGSVAGDITVAFVLGIGIVFVIFLYILITIASGVSLIFTFKNRHSTLKPVRIINYVYDGLFIAIILLAIVKFIMFGVGV